MSTNLIRIAVRSASKVPARALCTTAVRNTDIALDQRQKDKIYPKIGNRDIVGFGFNGSGSYADREEFPCPGIRFKENSPDVLALREKEKGDWKTLTLEEKKELYRNSFCLTFAEMKAPTGEWKSIAAAFLLCMSATAWVIMWLKTFVYQPMPRTVTEEWKRDSARRFLNQRQGRITAFSSNYDFEKEAWK